jgi:hypothetical protein
MTFSSYPGCLSSTDDFYLVNKRFTVMETTIDILNDQVYTKVMKADKYLPDYMRINIANRMANAADNWVSWFGHINTGTYNSQWLISDLQVF